MVKKFEGADPKRFKKRGLLRKLKTQPLDLSFNVSLALFSEGHASRRGEGVAMETVMKQLGLQVVKMTEPGLMDGGDVLFTGREFFVGLSTRTNQVRTSSIKI